MFFTILKSKNVDFKGSFICGSRVSGGDPLDAANIGLTG